jgi:hypothetical protein
MAFTPMHAAFGVTRSTDVYRPRVTSAFFARPANQRCMRQLVGGRLASMHSLKGGRRLVSRGRLIAQALPAGPARSILDKPSLVGLAELQCIIR